MATVIYEIFKTLTIFVILACAGFYLVQQMKINAGMVKKLSEQSEEITELKVENVELSNSMQNMKNQFSVLTDLTQEQRRDLVATKLSERLTDASSEIKGLKDIMLQTPEKAIKLERLQIKQDAEFDKMKTKFESLKDQFGLLQSLLYLMVTLIISLLLYLWRKAHTEKLHNQ